MRLLLAAAALWSPTSVVAGEVTVAVASNFALTAEQLADVFESATDHEVRIAQGSTGQLYAQVVNGAPYDVFLAADDKRPALLGDKATSVRTYALGKLVLVSRRFVDIADPAEDFEGKTVALADPIVAPYGLAAISAMERMQLDTATFKPLLLSNVAQVATIFQTGNADIAFVAASLIELMDPPNFVPLDGMHPDIRQDAAFLSRASENPAATAFWEFLFSETGQSVIANAGYGLVE